MSTKSRHIIRAGIGGLILFTLTLGLQAQESNVEMRLRSDLAFLASEECEGRGVDTKGLERAALYIARQFKAAGLKPGGKNGSWFQPFNVSRPGKLDKGSRLVLHGPQGQAIELAEGKHFNVMGYSAAGKVKAPVVFVCYGATAARIKYDDYKGVDTNGKMVIAIRRVPRWNSKLLPFDGDKKTDHAALVNKLANAEVHRAGAMLLVNDVSVKNDKLLQYQELSRGFSAGSIPALHIRRDVVDQLLRTSLGKSLPELEAAIDADLQPQSAELNGWTATIEAKVDRRTVTVKNVIGVLEGSGPLAKEIVVIGAHHDHLGYGERGSLAKKGDRKKIHYGADDNASGTTAVMELARRFGKIKNRRGRKLVFMTFSAEEKGLLGSRHYCKKEPLFPLKDTVAMVNLDMVGRMQKNRLNAQGTGTAKSFDSLIEKLNEKYKFTLRKVKSGTGPSDHASFYGVRIPVFFLWTGTHKDYHRPTDTFDRINYKDMIRITGLAEDVVAQLSNKSTRPQFVLVKGGGGAIRPGNIPKLGIRPAYDEKTKGLGIDGVSPGGAAAIAGMKDGDVITAINKQPITNIRTYMLIMSQQKRGKTIPITVKRGKKTIILKITPQ